MDEKSVAPIDNHLVACVQDSHEFIPDSYRSALETLLHNAPHGCVPLARSLCETLLTYSLMAKHVDASASTLQHAASACCISVYEKICEASYHILVFPVCTEGVLGSCASEDEHEQDVDSPTSTGGGKQLVVSCSTPPQSGDQNPWYISYWGKFLCQVDLRPGTIVKSIKIPTDLWNSWDTAGERTASTSLWELRDRLDILLHDRNFTRYYDCAKNTTAYSVHFVGNNGEAPFEIDTTGNLKCTTQNDKQVSRDECDFRTLEIVIASQAVDMENFWSGCWRSVWVLSIEGKSNDGHEGRWKLKGVMCTQLGYFESGTAFGEHCRSCERTISIGQPERMEDVAQEIVKIIQEEDSKFHSSILVVQNALHKRMLRQVKRLFPLNHVEFKWRLPIQDIAQSVLARASKKE